MKVSIIGGAGLVGSSAAFALQCGGIVSEIALLDLNLDLAGGHALDLLHGTPSVADSAALLERYFEALLAWNRETGWDEMIDITIWRTPIYDEGKDLTEAMTRLRKVIAQGKPYAGYESIDEFFAPITGRLRQKYGADSVMVGCIEPFKLALVQGW